ncbi:hypothetical protein ACFOLD_11210 [Kocuria carniphila]|uniref:hypothetical protein n=1 Tax=Kocuria carniphila TaxID=262208 RepID=UPI00360E5498
MPQRYSDHTTGDGYGPYGGHEALRLIASHVDDRQHPPLLASKPTRPTTEGHQRQPQARGREVPHAPHRVTLMVGDADER